ncbi:alcohol dehydrogenase [Litorivivens lipolytica]|uniref:Alcohol dehydrogenase n=1 Tax=Litorivivens lipolytica TaxID=1524264 RepID=A0A7W4Z883_9GAMM|nr:iron-containing alcohol dehydrogenase [Litorivivens lipolytica]MBB3048755.1 alcohol dehydrogenase [Litorivivens lipolytica]
MDFQFETCRRMVFAPGASEQLPAFCRELELTHLLLVTDPGLLSTGIVDTLGKLLERSGLSVSRYSDVEADPPEQVVLAAADYARQQGVDGIIGLGGGSSMDVAKLIAVLARSSQPLNEMYGIGNVRGDRLPLIQIPTTAGTGSEVTPIAIVTTGETTKMGVVSPQLLPDIALLDPALTTGLPPAVTAATGIDAMVHAIEAYTSKIKKNPYSDMLARQALTLMAANLHTAIEQGNNLEARANMLLGACLAGQAFANAPVAAVHALAYPLGGHYHIPHGLSNSLVLPSVLEFNASAAANLYAELLPCVRPGDTVLSPTAACDQFIQAMRQLVAQAPLPQTLKQAGVPESDLALLASDAMLQQRLLVNNPREVSEADALAIYRAAF